MRPTDRKILLALVCVNLLLRLAWLGRNELSHDEPFTVYWALRPLGEFFAMLGTENNPPLFFLVVRVWVDLVPLDAAWLRGPSALFSAITVLPLFLLTRRMVGRTGALAACALFTLSAYHQGFAHEVRAYSLFTLLATAGMWQLVRLGEGRPRALVWLALLNTAMAYTHFFGWLMIGVQALCLPLVKERGRTLRAWAAGLGITVVAYLPYVSVLAQRAGESIGRGTWLTVPPAEEIYNMVWRWSNAPVIAVVLLMLILWTVVRQRGRGVTLGIGLIWTFVPLLGMWVVSQWVPMYLDRYLVYAAPGFCLLIGHCVNSLPRVPAIVGTAALAIGLGLTMEPWKDNGMKPSAVVGQVQVWRAPYPDAAVLVVPSWYRLSYRWSEDRSTFADEPPDSLGSNVLYPSSQADPRVVLLVDAGAGHEEKSTAVMERIHAHYPQHEVVEAYHTVSIHRFQR